MQRGRVAMVVAVGLPLALALAIPLARGGAVEQPAVPLAKVRGPAPAAPAVAAPPPPTLAGLDLSRIDVKDGLVTAPLPDKRTARLSVEPTLQRVADRVMAMHHLPEAAVVVMDVETGKVLVYASHVESGPKRDLAVEATAPAASVFKIVTGTSLIENAHLGPDHKACYSGGEHRISALDLVPDPKRDRWCTTLAGAMGRSINTVFARLAATQLEPARLEETARALGFGAPLPFDVPVQASAIRIPDDQLGYARTAAGFWNTTLSPVHAAWLGAAIARGGEPVRPTLVGETASGDKVQWTAPTAVAQPRVMKAETAQALTTMMESTVSDGTSYRAFRDARGRAFLPGVSVAGKTGTLTDGAAQRFYTWFAGFAPSRPVSLAADASGREPVQPRKVAVGVLVVNGAKWTIKANVLAREVLRAYFAEHGVPGVTAPLTQARQGRSPARSTTPATKQRRQRGS